MFRRITSTVSALALALVSPPVSGQGIDQTAIDNAVPPGEDFYAYANGNWLRSTPLPDDRPIVGIWHTMQDNAYAKVRGLIQDSAVRRGSRIGDLYASYMDEAAIARRGIDPLHDLLSRIGQARDHRAMFRLTGDLMRYDVAAPIRIAVGEDDKNPGWYVLTLSPGGLGLADPSTYLADDARNRRLRSAYRTFVESLLAFAGTDRVRERADALLAFETALAKAHTAAPGGRDIVQRYNPRTLAMLQADAPGIDWQAFFEGMGIADPGTFIVSQPDALRAEASVLAQTPIETFRDFTRVRLLSAYARYLPPEAERARFAFYGTALKGTTRMPPRWRQGVALTINLLGKEVGKAYADRYYTRTTRREAERMVANIVAALDRKLAYSTWLSPGARASARAKLAATRFEIGAPEQWPDSDRVEIGRDDLIGNVRRASAAYFAQMIARIGKQVPRDEWISSVVTPNAYASAGANKVIFPAATLQPPLFDPGAGAAFNYARIGATIGHELSHLFDDQGRKYDATGRLGSWWNDADEAEFLRREAALVDQYGAYQPFPDQAIDGKRTVGENIADLAGLEIAYAAFRRTPDSREPAVDGFTPDQLFFIAWAQMWRARYQPEALRSLLRSDAHAPDRERAWTVRNLDPWYDAFDVTEKNAMYLPPEKRITFW